MKKLSPLGLTALLLAWGVAQAQINKPPVAVADPDRTMVEGTSLMLDATGSFDTDGDPFYTSGRAVLCNL
jgi:hypothetical protein